jgi:hypothetical protein
MVAPVSVRGNGRWPRGSALRMGGRSGMARPPLAPAAELGGQPSCVRCGLEAKHGDEAAPVRPIGESRRRANGRLLPENRGDRNRRRGPRDRRAATNRSVARPILAGRLQIRHARLQSRGPRPMGGSAGAGLHPLRLFRPWGIGRCLRGGNHRPLAGGKHRDFHRLL